MASATPIPSLRFERQAWKAGAHWVAGVDEVGVGPLAGPVTAACVALPPNRRFKWYKLVRDSKVLPEEARVELAAMIQRDVPWAIGWASHLDIDRINIYQARKLCMLRAFESLSVTPDHILSDALPLPLPSVQPIIDGDALSVAIAAASIIAKVARDALMEELCAKYPGYGFCRNKGYPTPEHKRLLLRRGPCEIHRRSFAPVAQFSLNLTYGDEGAPLPPSVQSEAVLRAERRAAEIQRRAAEDVARAERDGSRAGALAGEPLPIA